MDDAGARARGRVRAALVKNGGALLQSGVSGFVTFQEGTDGIASAARALLGSVEQALVHRINREDFQEFLPLWLLLERVEADQVPADLALQSSVAATASVRGLKGPVAKARAWLRQVLNAGVSSACVAVLLGEQHRKLRRVFYKEGAFMRDDDSTTTLLQILGALDRDLRFNLPIDLEVDELNDVPFWPLVKEAPAPAIVAPEAQIEESGIQESSAQKTTLGLLFGGEPLTPETQRRLSEGWAGMTAFLFGEDVTQTKEEDLLAVDRDPVASVLFGDALPAEAEPSLADVACFGTSLEEVVANPAQCSMAYLDPALSMPDIVLALLIRLEDETANQDGIFRKEPAQEEVLGLAQALSQGCEETFAERQEALMRRISTVGAEQWQRFHESAFLGTRLVKNRSGMDSWLPKTFLLNEWMLVLGDLVSTAKAYSPQAAAALLKEYLSRLPSPLLSAERFDAFIACAQIEDEEQRVRNVKLLLMDLPWLSRPLLARLFKAFEVLSSGTQGCALTSRALALNVASSILRPPVVVGGLSDPEDDDDMRVTVAGAEVVELLIRSREGAFQEMEESLRSRAAVVLRKCAVFNGYVLDLTRDFDASVPGDFAALSAVHEGLRDVDADVELPVVSSGTDDAEALQNLPIWSRWGFCSPDESGLSSFSMACRAGGALTVKCIAYAMTKGSHSDVKDFLREIRPELDGQNVIRAVDFSVVSINLVCLLADLLRLAPTPMRPNVSLESFTKTAGWGILDHVFAFEELYCLGFLMFRDRFRAHCIVEESPIRAANVALQETQDDVQRMIYGQLPDRPSVRKCWRMWEEHHRESLEQLEDAAEKQGADRPANGVSDPTKAFISTKAESEHAAVVPAGADDASSGVASAAESPVLGTLRHRSEILTEDSFKELQKLLPPNEQQMDWTLAYSIRRHGASLSTLYKRCKALAPSMVAIRDDQGFVFGGYATSAWEIHENEDYGTTDNFVWSLSTGVLQAFAATGKNSSFQFSRSDAFGFGGGEQEAIWIDANLLRGRCGECETFDNAPLAFSARPNGAGAFLCLRVEVWALVTRAVDSA